MLKWRGLRGLAAQRALAGASVAASLRVWLLERRVSRMVGFLVGIFVLGVVATDQRPARIGRCVLIGAMEEIAVEEKCVTRIEFHVDKLHDFGGCVGALGVGAGLVAVPTVFDAAHFVGALQHLQAAVVAGVGIDGDESRAHVGKETAVLVLKSRAELSVLGTTTSAGDECTTRQTRAPATI